MAMIALRTMMTPEGAEDMRGTLTPFGRRVVQFIQEEHPQQ